MEKFGIITNKNQDIDLKITNKITAYIKKNNRECQLFECHYGQTCGWYTDINSIPEDVDCIIVLGGDGTILQAANDTASRKIPILGINIGTLGFLAETELHNIYEALDNLFKDEYSLEYRMMLEGSIKRNGKEIHTGHALNEIVAERCGFSRVVSLSVYVNGELANRYRGDGIIISTPTGSTGYNLSANGPIVAPYTQVLIVTPICAHTINSRSVVLDARDEIWVRIETSKKTQDKEVLATFDGHKAVELHAEDIIEIKKSQTATKFIKFKSNNFFETIRRKFGNFEEK